MRYILFLLLLSSCYTPQKSARQLSKAAIVYPEKTARALRLLWPCDTTGSDTTYIEGDRSGYDEMIASLNNELNASYYLQDSLAKSLAADTNCIEYAAGLVKSVVLIDRAKGSVRMLPVPIDTARIRETVTDRSEVAACELEKRKMLDVIADLNKGTDTLRGKLNTRTPIMWAALALILVFIIYKIIRLVK